MRYLRRQTLNRRAVYDNTLYVDTNKAVVMGSRVSLTLPTGDETEYPAIYENGMIRYNSGTYDAITNPNGGQVEVYQGDSWRALRYKESGAITQQTLGVGDGDTVYFGPLNPAPPVTSQSGYSWTGANLLVIVENVIQLYTTNYIVDQDPTFSAEIYDGTVSRTEIIGATRIYFNTSLQTTGASGSGTTATLTFDAQPAAPFSIGEVILITGMTPYGYNGSAIVTSCNETSVSYVNTTTGAQTVAGTITSAHTIYPAVDITGAIVTGTNIPTSTIVTAYTTDDMTGALTSIDISNAVSGAPLIAGTAITIAENSQQGTGWYLHFSSPVPAGKPVIVLHGFDQ